MESKSDWFWYWLTIKHSLRQQKEMTESAHSHYNHWHERNYTFGILPGVHTLKLYNFIWIRKEILSFLFACTLPWITQLKSSYFFQFTSTNGFLLLTIIRKYDWKKLNDFTTFEILSHFLSGSILSSHYGMYKE